MACCRKHVQTCSSSSCVGAVIYCFHQIFIDTHGNRIGIFVIITEERRMISDILPHDLCIHFLTGIVQILSPVTCQRLEHLIHCIAMVFIDVFLQCRKAVGDGTKSCTLNISSIIAGTATIIVSSLLDTVINEQTKECLHNAYSTICFFKSCLKNFLICQLFKLLIFVQIL